MNGAASEERAEHRDVAILRSLPGTGRINLATLLSEASGPLSRRDYQALRTLSGVAPVDSSVSETHAAQEGTAYNGHFGCTCYHPLYVFNQFGDLERCTLRPGNVHLPMAGANCSNR